ncbi:hypothetical protein V8E36_002532 [Tilletia maclaganii]
MKVVLTLAGLVRSLTKIRSAWGWGIRPQHRKMRFGLLQNDFPFPSPDHQILKPQEWAACSVSIERLARSPLHSNLRCAAESEATAGRVCAVRHLSRLENSTCLPWCLALGRLSKQESRRRSIHTAKATCRHRRYLFGLADQGTGNHPWNSLSLSTLLLRACSV